jgi:hypothetical protein
MRSTVEGHMFGHMGQTLLVFIFLNGAGIQHQPQFYFLLRFPVLPDVVGKAICQLADLYFSINR